MDTESSTVALSYFDCSMLTISEANWMQTTAAWCVAPLWGLVIAQWMRCSITYET